MMMTPSSNNNSSTSSSTSSSAVSTPSNIKYEDASSFAVTGPEGKRPYYGKCQYKTGKCFNERALKRNGEPHSLCEEHRIKQNLIQRRSDRKYQSVHAIRRRERSQRRAILKKQVSMAVAQQLFYEHQQQKTLGLHIGIPGINLPLHHSHHSHSLHGHHHSQHHHHQHSHSHSRHQQYPSSSSSSSSNKHNDFGGHHFTNPFLTAAEGLPSPMLSVQNHSSMYDLSTEDDEAATVAALKQEEEEENNNSPTTVEDFTPDSFLSFCVTEDSDALATLGAMGHHHGSSSAAGAQGEVNESWSNNDIDFLHNLLMA